MEKTVCVSYNFETPPLSKSSREMESLGSTDGAKRYSPFWDGLMFFFIIVMALGLIAYATGVLLHVAVRHTYFDPASPMGVLVSDRYVTITWWALATSVLQLFVPALVCFVWIDRWLQKPGWVYLWVVLIGLAVILQLLVVIKFGRDYANCNAQGEFGNLCNSLLRCCVPEIYANIVNQCPPGPCVVAVPPVPIPATIGDLFADPMFVALFCFNASFLGISLLIFLILLGTQIYEGTYTILHKVRAKKATTEDDDESGKVEDVESQMFTNTGEVVTTRRRKNPPKKSAPTATSPVVLEVPVTHLITQMGIGTKRE